MTHPAFLGLLLCLLLPLPTANAAICHLNIQSHPPGAKVYIDGKFVGHTPLRRIRQRAGQRLLSFVSKGHATVDRMLRCPPGKVSTFQIKLRKAMASLTLHSTPPKARVWINGRAAGRTPLTRSLPTGKHRVVLRLYHHKTIHARIRLKNTQALVHRVQMQPEDGQLVVNSTPQGAFVYKGTTYLGKTPLRRLLPGGTYTIVLRKKGFPVLSRAVQVPPLGALRLQLSLRSKPKLKPGMLAQLRKTYQQARKQVYQLTKRGALLHPKAARLAPIEGKIRKALRMLALTSQARKHLQIRLQLLDLYRDARRWFRAKGFALNDKRNTTAWPKAKAAQQRVWKIADYYSAMELFTTMRVLANTPQLPTGLRCKLRYSEGLALQRKRNNAARYSFFALVNNPKNLGCKEIGPAYTRLAMLYVNPFKEVNRRLVHDLFQRALSYKPQPTYALALFGYARFYKRNRKYSKALPLFARCLRQVRLNLGKSEHKLLQVNLFSKCHLEVVLAYRKVGKASAAKAYFRKWGGEKHYKSMLRSYRGLIKASKYMHNKPRPRPRTRKR